MNIGFTGTRQGTTSKQKEVLTELFKDYTGYILHHGDCIGSDEEAFNLAVENKLKTVAYPCTIENLRVYTKSDIIMEIKEPLDRNHDIVNNCDLLIACSGESQEIVRSGTWATIRYAKKLFKPIKVIWPDGEISEYNC